MREEFGERDDRGQPSQNNNVPPNPFLGVPDMLSDEPNLQFESY